MRHCRPTPLATLPMRFSLRSRLVFLFWSVVLAPSWAWAHNPIASWATIQVHPDHLEIKLELASESAWLVLGEKLDRAPEIEPALPRLRARAGDLYRVSVEGETLALKESSVELREEDGVEFRLRFPRPSKGLLRVDVLYLKLLPSDHHTSLAMTDGGEQPLASELLTAAKPWAEFLLPPLAASSENARNGSQVAPARPRPASASFSSFFKLGVEHILTGYDHLLFLFGLLVVCRRISSMLTIITCFTLAHSLTLALAALDLVSIPSRVVEPLIAASIVFVGLENLLRREEPRGRWLLTFAFGLIHGFGFASVLREIGLGTSGAALFGPLFSFNLGVELGQIAVAAVILPLLWPLRKWPAFSRHGTRILSALILLAGVYWLLQRTLLA